jgi:hypothetical protein
MSGRGLGKTALARVDGSGGWTTWIDRSRSGERASVDTLGRRGLWRAVRREEGIDTTFACPPLSRLVGIQEETSLSGEAAVREWACATANDDLPDAWSAPVRTAVEDWFDADRLSVRAGAHIAKGELECGPERLRLRFPDLVRLDPRLPESRQAWVRALCLDAQSRWHLVRFGVVEERVCAEVDLSGAPPVLAESLVGWALEALVFSVGWALPAFALVADPDVSCPALDLGPGWLREVGDHQTSPTAGPSSVVPR